MTHFDNADPPYEGGCLCGAVRFRIEAPTLGARICHCRQCQKAMAAPFLAAAAFPRKAVRFNRDTARFRSSHRLWRHFCPGCGSRLFLEPVDHPDRLGVPIALLDDPGAIRPEMHVWWSERAPWLQVDDDLPKHPEGSPVPFRAVQEA